MEMKKFVTGILLTFVLVGTINAQSFRFGAGAQLIFDGSIFGVQGKAIYDVNDSFDAAATFTVHLKEFVDWSFDVDAHYKLLELGEDIGFKPFAGLSITRVSIDFAGISQSDTDIGLNLGAFFDLLKTGNIQLYVEPKIIIGGAQSIAVSGGILF